MSNIKNQKVMRLLMVASIFFQAPIFGGGSLERSAQLRKDCLNKPIGLLTDTKEKRASLLEVVERVWDSEDIAAISSDAAMQISPYRFLLTASCAGVFGLFTIVSWLKYPVVRIFGCEFNCFITVQEPYNPANQNAFYMIIKNFCDLQECRYDLNTRYSDGLFYNILIYPVKLLLKVLFIPINFIVGCIILLPFTAILSATLWAPSDDKKEIINAFKKMQVAAANLRKSTRTEQDTKDYMKTNAFLTEAYQWMDVQYNALEVVENFNELVSKIKEDTTSNHALLLATLQLSKREKLGDLEEEYVQQIREIDIEDGNKIVNRYFLLSQPRPSFAGQNTKQAIEKFDNPLDLEEKLFITFARDTLKVKLEDIYAVLTGERNAAESSINALIRIIDGINFPKKNTEGENLKASMQTFLRLDACKDDTAISAADYKKLEDAKTAFDNQATWESDDQKSKANLNILYKLIITDALSSKVAQPTA